jgi:hypothetical protein
VLADAFRIGMQMRAEMRAAGASEREMAAALERVIRANWPVKPESEWPYWARVPRCIYCNSYGLVMRSEVDRLGQYVEVGTPCTCQAGVRHMPASPAQQDYTQAGKTAKKPTGGFRRWDG